MLLVLSLDLLTAGGLRTEDMSICSLAADLLPLIESHPTPQE